MAVEQFIPVKDAKQTVEKEVKEKPKLAELITIERPGRDVERLEEGFEEGKKRRTRKKDAVEPTSIKQPKKDSILIVTEKPQAAQKIALALGNPKRIVEKNVPYYTLERNGEKIIVASAVGHLFGLTYKQGQKGWPIFEIEWEPSYEKKSAAFTKNYYDVLNKMAKKAKEVIIATDYDIEGEVIGWNVLRFICKKNNAKRMKYSTLTKDELVKTYENPMKELDWGQAYAGETRHILDWLYGINLSRALMEAVKKTGTFKILSIGRVQGPALKIIVDREKEIANFKPEPYWEVYASVNGMELKHPKDIFDKNELKKFEGLTEGVASTTERKEKTPPPVPFDLTTLQREAYRIARLTPSQTLAVAQKLYLDGLISYPRTSSQKIPFSIEPRKILKKLEKYYPEVKEATRDKPFEGKKDDPAHPSIYPTGEFAELDGSDKKIYDLIVRRFIAVFSPDAVTMNKRIVLLGNGKQELNFTASGLKIIDKGWTKVYPIEFEEKEVPTINGNVKIDKIKTLEKETQPPKRYSPTSLVTLLEKKNLGTKATRSSIVDTLFDRGYLDGKSIEATPLGVRLIESLEKYSPIIIDENLTRQLEDEMEKILGSKSDLKEKEEKVVEKAKKLIIDISKEFKAREMEIGRELVKGMEDLRKIQQESNILMPCKTCGNGNLRIMFSPKMRRYFIGCSNYPECKQTYSLPPNALAKRSDKTCESCGFVKVMMIRKGKKPWELCFNYDCEIVKKQRAEWEARKALWNKKKDSEKAESNAQ